MEPRNAVTKKSDVAEATENKGGLKKEPMLDSLEKPGKLSKAVAALAAAGMVAAACANDSVPFDTDGEDQADVGDVDSDAEVSQDAADVETSEAADVEEVGETVETDAENEAADGEEATALCERLSNESRATYFLTLDDDTPVGASGYSIKWTGPSADGRGMMLELSCGGGDIPVASNDNVTVPSTWEVDRTATGEGKVTVYAGTMMGGRAVVSVTVSDVI